MHLYPDNHQIKITLPRSRNLNLQRDLVNDVEQFSSTGTPIPAIPDRIRAAAARTHPYIRAQGPEPIWLTLSRMHVYMGLLLGDNERNARRQGLPLDHPHYHDHPLYRDPAWYTRPQDWLDAYVDASVISQPTGAEEPYDEYEGHMMVYQMEWAVRSHKRNLFLMEYDVNRREGAYTDWL